MADLRPTAGQNPWDATWNAYEAVSRNTDGTIKGSSRGVIWLQDYGADNTGLVANAATVNDVAFRAAIVAAQATATTDPSFGTTRYWPISGLPGLYLLGGYAGLSGSTFFGPTLAIPGGIQFAGFGGGATACARFHFKHESSLPTAIGTVSSTYTAGDATMALNNVKNVFAPASVTYPQWAQINSGALFQYTGITGSGSSVTLTGIGPTALGNAAAGSTVSANTAVIAMGGVQPGYQIDHTIEILGPTGSLPTHGTTLNGSVTLPQATITLTSTSGWPTSGEIMIAGPKFTQPVKYTGVSGSNLTGCTGGSGTIATGSVIYTAPPNTMDGIWIGTGGSVDCQVAYFRHATIFMGDHERWGPHFSVPQGSCWSLICAESPLNTNWVTKDSGDQLVEWGAELAHGVWCNIYVTANTAILSAVFGGGKQGAFSPWHIWKESSLNTTTNGNTAIMQQCSIYDTSFENPGLGLVGCSDPDVSYDIYMGNCNLLWSANNTAPGGVPPVAEFCGSSSLAIVGGNMFTSNSPRGYANTPYFLGDTISGSTTYAPQSFLQGRAVICMVPDKLSSGKVFVYFQFNGAELRCCVDGSVAKGNLMSDYGIPDTTAVPDQFNYISKDDVGSGVFGALAGVAIADFAQGNGSFWVGPIANSRAYGPVPVLVHTGGDITRFSLVRSNGAVARGTAISDTPGNTTGIIFGTATQNDDGTYARVIISPSLS